MVSRPDTVPEVRDEIIIRDYSYAREELQRVQTATIEAELEEAHRQEREQILAELDRAKAEAQTRLMQQQKTFEDRLAVCRWEKSSMQNRVGKPEE